MTPDDLKARTKKFAVDVIALVRTVAHDAINDQIASQLTRSAMSTAAHYRAVCRAKSRADFISKLGGAIEEVDESALWLELLVETRILGRTEVAPLWREADELTRIFVRSRETARTQSPNPQSSPNPRSGPSPQSGPNQQSRIKNPQRIKNQ